MNHFALITEGITDQVTIESILMGFYEYDLDVTSIQPSRDSTDESRQESHGGWEQVLEKCGQDDFADIFLYNKYLIIHIDTDCGEHNNYNISLTNEGVDRDPLAIISDVELKLRNKIGTSIYDDYKNRIIFAIAVHSTDCWYLTAYATHDAHKTKVKNCANTLEKIIIKNGERYSKGYECYLRLSRIMEDRDTLEAMSLLNVSLQKFIINLPEKNNLISS